MTSWILFAYHTIGACCLEALLARGERVVTVVTHADDPTESAWFASVADLARTHGIPVLTPSSPNAPDVVAQISAWEPDIVLSVWYRRLLGPTLLALPRLAALNLHGSLLPAYRGRAPLNWVLVNGETRTGVTLHHMTEEADAGDIVAQEAIDIDAEDTAASLYGRMVKAGVDLLVRSYPAIVAGVAPRIPQDHTRATLVGRRRPEDGRVRWDWDATRIANMIRAVGHPYPGAFVGDGGQRLYLWAGRAESGAAGAPPGTVLELASGRGVVVAAGHGRLRLTRVQESGVIEEDADAWATRRGLTVGAVVGAPA